MAEEKKRFPWWLVATAALLLVAAVLGFIETVGWRGTIVGRYERIQDGMSEAEALSILGPGDPVFEPSELSNTQNEQIEWNLAHPGTYVGYHVKWQEGPARVLVIFVAPSPAAPAVLTSREWFGWPPQDHYDFKVMVKIFRMTNDIAPAWDLRRWAEQAYTAIHGPRR
jgi:hypothetical protein